MPVLDVSEYNASYFDGRLQAMAHNAGYGRYARWYRSEGEGSQGEWWKDYAARWVDQLALSGKSVLDVGCAKGFLVEDLCDAGVDAYGLDVSDWAINSCNDPRTDLAAKLRRSDLASRFYLGDVRTALAQFVRNQFDFAVSFRFLECLDPADLPGVVTELNRVSRNQVHIVDQFTGAKEGAGAYYTQHTTAEWRDSYGWSKGTRFIAMEQADIVVSK